MPTAIPWASNLKISVQDTSGIWHEVGVASNSSGVGSYGLYASDGADASDYVGTGTITHNTTIGSKLIEKLYGSVNGKTKKITKLYGSVNGKTKLVFQG